MGSWERGGDRGGGLESAAFCVWKVATTGEAATAAMVIDEQR